LRFACLAKGKEKGKESLFDLSAPLGSSSFYESSSWKTAEARKAQNLQPHRARSGLLLFYLENALHSCFDKNARVEGWIETSVS
jgi:hypothetical protein